MKDIFVSDIKTNQDITSYFMVKSVAIKVGSNKKNYLDLNLSDKSGEINGKKWNIQDDEIAGLQRVKEGSIIKIRAAVTEWNGIKQLNISKIRLTGAEDMIEMSDFIKAAPERAEDMYEFIYGKTSAFRDEELKKLCLYQLEKHREKLMYYPAAAKNHHAEMAGLLWHVKRMLMMAERACQVYTNLNADLLMAGVVLHDIEKLVEIESNELGISSGYSFEGKMLGHLVMGVRELDKLCLDMGIEREKAIMLEHMLLSHHYHPEFGSPIRPLFPEAEMLHYLDMVDAKMYDMEDAVNKAEPGGFSERVWTLDNRTIYRVKEETKNGAVSENGVQIADEYLIMETE